jgi:hypothetical protein
MSVLIRLYQEGHLITVGAQTVDWIDLAHTSPTEFVSLFVLEKTDFGLPDLFGRIAEPEDFGTLTVNPVNAFEPRGLINTINPYTPQLGDKLYIDVMLKPQWLLTTLINSDSYTKNSNGFMEFIVNQNISFGGRQLDDAPPAVAGQQVTVSNYVFTQTDVGRQLYLTGFTNLANNGPCQIRFVSGSTATTSKTFITELNTPAASWYYTHVEVASPMFPRVEYMGSWELWRGGAPYMTGSNCVTKRKDSSLLIFRDDRVFLVHTVLDIAKNHFEFVKSYVQSLQRRLSASDGSMLAPAYFDYGP